MVRGQYYYICPSCGHIFKGLDIELNATVESMPVHCPKCHSKAVRTIPVGMLGRMIGRTNNKPKI